MSKTVWKIKILTAIVLVMSVMREGYCQEVRVNPEHYAWFKEVGEKGLEAFGRGEKNETTLLLMEQALVGGSDWMGEQDDLYLLSNLMGGITELRHQLIEEDLQHLYFALMGFGFSNFSADKFTFGVAPEQHPALELEESLRDESDTALIRLAVGLMTENRMQEAEQLLLYLYGKLWYRNSYAEELKYVVANKMAIYYMRMNLPDEAKGILRQNKIELEKNALRNRDYAETLTYLGFTEFMDGFKIKGYIYHDVAEVLMRSLGMVSEDLMADYIAVMESESAPEEEKADDRKPAKISSSPVLSFIRENDQDLFFLTEKERLQRWEKLQKSWEHLKTGVLESDSPDIDDLLNATEYEKQIMLRSYRKTRDAIARSRDPEAKGIAKRLLEIEMAMARGFISDTEQMKAEHERLQKAMLHQASLRSLNEGLYEPLTAAEIAGRLRDDETFLDFGKATIGGQTRYYAITITADNPTGRLTILCTTDELRDFMARTEDEDARRMVKKRYGANNLTDMIWTPISRTGTVKEKVMYSPADELNSIMLEAIPHDGRCLGEDREFHILSSAEGIKSKRRGETYRPEEIALFGGMEYLGDREKLILNAQEYGSTRPLRKHFLDKDQVPVMTWHSDQTIARLDTPEDYDWLLALSEAKKVPLRPYMAEDASEYAFKSLAGSFKGALNIYTHAFYLPKETDMLGHFYLMDQSLDLSRIYYYATTEGDIGAALLPLYRTGLMLSGAQRVWCATNQISDLEDGVVNGYELAAMDLGEVGLATLFACETGAGDIDEYEGVMGIRRALKLSGCRSIVSSAWNLDSEAAMDYMRTFYTSLLDGHGISASHRKAQLELIRQYDNPYYWAVFQLVD